MDVDLDVGCSDEDCLSQVSDVYGLLDDDEASENELIVGSDGEEEYIRPGDVCQDSDVLQREMREEQMYPEDEVEEDAALGNVDIPAIEYNKISLKVVREHGVSVEKTVDVPLEEGSVSACLKRHLTLLYKMDIELYSDVECKSIIKDRDPIYAVDPNLSGIFVEIRTFIRYDTDRVQERAEVCERHKMALETQVAYYNEQIRIAAKERAAGKSSFRLPTNETKVVKLSKKYTARGRKKFMSVCESSGTPRTLVEKQEDLVTHFEFMFDCDFTRRFFAADDILGSKMVNMIQAFGKKSTACVDKEIDIFRDALC